MLTPGMLVWYRTPIARSIINTIPDISHSDIIDDHILLVIGQDMWNERILCCFTTSNTKMPGFLIDIPSGIASKDTGVILPYNIVSVNVSNFRSVVGYIPSNLLKVVKNAVAYHIGLSDTVPLYMEKYKKQYTVMVNDGIRYPNYKQAELGKDMTYKNIDPCIQKSINNISLMDKVIIRSASNMNDADLIITEESVDDSSMIKTDPLKEDDKTKIDDNSSKVVKFPATSDKQKTTTNEEDIGRRRRYVAGKSTNSNPTKKVLPEKPSNIRVRKRTLDIFKSLPVDKTITIYCEKRPITKWAEYLGCSPYIAAKLIPMIQSDIEAKKARLIKELIGGKKSLKFLTDDDIPLLKTLDPADLQTLRLPFNTFKSYLSMYGFNDLVKELETHLAKG